MCYTLRTNSECGGANAVGRLECLDTLSKAKPEAGGFSLETDWVGYLPWRPMDRPRQAGYGRTRDADGRGEFVAFRAARRHRADWLRAKRLPERALQPFRKPTVLAGDPAQPGMSYAGPREEGYDVPEPLDDVLPAPCRILAE